LITLSGIFHPTSFKARSIQRPKKIEKLNMAFSYCISRLDEEFNNYGDDCRAMRIEMLAFNFRPDSRTRLHHTSRVNLCSTCWGESLRENKSSEKIEQGKFLLYMELDDEFYEFFTGLKGVMVTDEEESV
jgi:hypothetical protein